MRPPSGAAATCRTRSSVCSERSSRAPGVQTPRRSRPSAPARRPSGRTAKPRPVAVDGPAPRGRRSDERHDQTANSSSRRVTQLVAAGRTPGARSCRRGRAGGRAGGPTPTSHTDATRCSPSATCAPSALTAKPVEGPSVGPHSATPAAGGGVDGRDRPLPAGEHRVAADDDADRARAQDRPRVRLPQRPGDDLVAAQRRDQRARRRRARARASRPPPAAAPSSPCGQYRLRYCPPVADVTQQDTGAGVPDRTPRASGWRR